MKFCIKCKGSGRVLVQSTLSSYPGSIDYYPQNCAECEGNGYTGKKKANQQILSHLSK